MSHARSEWRFTGAGLGCRVRILLLSDSLARTTIHSSALHRPSSAAKSEKSINPSQSLKFAARHVRSPRYRVFCFSSSIELRQKTPMHRTTWMSRFSFSLLGLALFASVGCVSTHSSNCHSFRPPGMYGADCCGPVMDGCGAEPGCAVPAQGGKRAMFSKHHRGSCKTAPLYPGDTWGSCGCGECGCGETMMAPGCAAPSFMTPGCATPTGTWATDGGPAGCGVSHTAMVPGQPGCGCNGGTNSFAPQPVNPPEQFAAPNPLGNQPYEAPAVPPADDPPAPIDVPANQNGAPAAHPPVDPVSFEVPVLPPITNGR